MPEPALIENVKKQINQTILDVTSSATAWADFIKKSAMFYKYKFSDKLMIYKNKPNATACADLRVWTKLNAKINEGSVGIPLLDSSTGNIRYVYDISDTNSKYELWQADKHLIDIKNLNEHIDKNVEKAVSLIPESASRAEFISFLSDSIKLAVYTRADLDTTSINNDFSFVTQLNKNQYYNFNTVQKIINKNLREILTGIEKNAVLNINSEKINKTSIKPTKHTEHTKFEKSNRHVDYTDEELNIARNTDLVEYLRRNGESIERVGTNEYTMGNHDSMRINGSQFFWNSQGFGGNAVDFCMKYYNMPFQEAVNSLLAFNGYIKGEYTPVIAPVAHRIENESVEEKPVNPLPNPLDSKANRIFAYLTKTRGIDADIVQQLVKEGKIAQDVKGNLVFKIYDPKLPDKLYGAEITGTLTEHRYKQNTDRNGNGFVINPTAGEKPEGAIFFEAAIDLLSYYTLHRDTKALLVSMAGLKDKVIKKTMQDYDLDPQFCFVSSDNDEAGVKFASKVQDEYGISVYRVVNDERFDNYSNIKDWNDLLLAIRKSPQPTPDKYAFLNNLKTGDYLVYENDIWKVTKLNDINITISNIYIAELELTVGSNEPNEDWRSVFRAEVDNGTMRYLPIEERINNVKLYKVGDFYEAFNEDASLLSETLGLKIAKKSIDNDFVSMVGMPYHSLESYILQLREKNIGVTLDSYENFLKLYRENKDLQTKTKETAEQQDLPYSENTREYDDEFKIPENVLNNLPDTSISIEDRNKYGYTSNALLPLSRDVALKYWDMDSFPIYMLFGDNTESMVYKREEIENFDDGILGVETEEWEKYLNKSNEIVKDNSQINLFDYDGENSHTDESKELDQAKELIMDFIVREYGEGEYSDVFDDLSNIDIAYTTTEDEEHTIQATVDLVNYTLQKKIDDSVVETLQYDTLSGLIIELYNLDYSELVDVTAYLDKSNSQQNTKNPLMPDDQGIIGNTIFRYIKNKNYRKLDKETALKVAEKLIENDINFSGKINSDKITLTVSGADAEKVDNIIDEVKINNKNIGINIIDTDTSTTDNEIKEKTPQNFRLTEFSGENISLKMKYRNNINAIKTLLNIERENKQATVEEQEILAKYVGWGGLSDVFDSSKTAWSNEYAELKELLAPDEYAAARSSTLNAHYTSPIIIKAMYNALDNMGFEKGRILEPAMGTGNFFGMLPEQMEGSKLYGVELDSLTGRIAKQLYPNAHIEVKGFEKTAFQSNFFDVAIGNVPFGNYKIYDNDFKSEDLIHDYFFKKTLDKVRPGGLIAFITSKGTLDKKDRSVRQYLAERAELLGAVRLPNNAFSNANTEVTSDIIFLQKRDRVLSFTEDNMPEWVHLSVDENNIEINSYFVNHKEMILGEMSEVSGRFGLETTCKPFEGADLTEQLEKAVQNIKGTITQDNVIDVPEEYQDQDISTDIIPENYRNFCYAVIDGDIYFRENNNMIKQDIKGKRAERLKGMVEISETLRELISAQRDDFPDSDIKRLQNKLNAVYDNFTAEFGILSSKANKNIFRDDDTAALLLALENLDKDGNLESKADIFFKRTVVPYAKVESVDTASEALAVSIGEKGRVDLDYMAHLCSKPKEEIIKDLEGVIFENPVTGVFENADEYLSGNVREKLSIAKTYAAQSSRFEVNVKSLEAVQPEDLKPAEISAPLGATWIPVKYYQQFMYELLDTPYWCRESIRSGDAFDVFNVNTVVIGFDKYTSNYGISNRTADSNNVKANTTYGTSRMNAYRIIESTLNMRPIRIYDYIEDEKGNKKAVLNNKETLLAQEKQTLIKNKFKEWVWDDYDRTQELCKIYNEKFNSIRPREYDGSHITFKGINPEITLRKHQIDAIAHTLYGGNTLLAHTVGAGKSFEMIASAMESKRLGLCSKSMIVVPKAIVNQMGKEFLQLYPTANILIPSEKDFSKENREKFCSRIATGNYDAIIISHNQLEKIPLSTERQAEFIQNELDEVEDFLIALHSDTSASRGFTVKQLESTRKNLEARLEKLNNADKRDTVITFEELGVDKLYIDEAHFFKNKYFYTKMDRIAGINSSSASQRAEDLFMKCRYLDEKTNNKGVVFATGTPISNSMVELYTMQTYLQYDELRALGLNHFDSWASTFGETQVALELAPEGKGYQMKTRFSKFFNLPELMNTFKAVADIKTPDMLNLPVPKANYHTIATEASEYQKDLVDGLAERAEAIRSKKVDISQDNMLNITNDGRKLALDQRLANPLLPDDPNSKVNACINNVYDIWRETTENRLTQIIFCDLSTPGGKDKNGQIKPFCVYDDIKSKLIKKGIPESEIAFIHDCKTDEQKLALFTKVQDGDVRVLLGSTSKLGTGTNCQNKLKAVHHLDCPYRPADLEQRNGRIIRQGNENSEVDIFNYVTKGTFDAYLYQLVENKQKFISQIMTSKSPARSAEDIDECVLSYAEIKALAAGDPKIKEKMDLDIEVNRLRTVFANYQENKRTLQENINVKYPEKIQQLNEYIKAAEKDVAIAEANSSEKFSGMTVDGTYFSDKKEAGTAFLESCRSIRPDEKTKPVGEYKGFKMDVSFDSFKKVFVINLKANLTYQTDIGTDVFGNITRLDNLLNSIDIKIKEAQNLLKKTKYQFEAAKKEVNEPFAQLDELREKESKLEKLNKELAIDGDSRVNSEDEYSLDSTFDDAKIEADYCNKDTNFEITKEENCH